MFSLNEFWYLLVSILFVGFIFLEGFDFGIGMVSRFLGRNDLERRAFINTIGPFWDANEVWLISAIGAMFAASKLVCNAIKRVICSFCSSFAFADWPRCSI